MAEIDVETIIYILFVVIYGIYSLYKKSMKDAEKKYGKPLGDSLPSPPEEGDFKSQKPEKPQSSPGRHKEIVDRGKSSGSHSDRKYIPKRQSTVREIQKYRPLIPATSPMPERNVLRPSISEHTSFLPGDLISTNLPVPEEGMPALSTQAPTHELPYNKPLAGSLPDDFDARTAVMYSILLERKEF